MAAFGRLWSTVACLATGVAVCATPASAAAARTSLTRQVTIAGDRTGWVSVDLPRPIAAECPGKPACARSAGLRLAGGAFGYFLVQENDKAAKPVPSVVVVRLPRTEGGHVIAVAGGTDPRTGAAIADTEVLPAGRYRLFILTNGRGSVSVRFPELRPAAVRLRATRAAPFRAVETAAPQAGPLAPSAWAGGITVPETGVRSHGYVFEWTRGPAAAGAVGGLCLYAGDPPAGQWVPGCPGGSMLLASQLMPSTNCCGTAYGSVLGGGGKFSFGSYYVQNGPVTSAGRFVLWVQDR